MNYWQGDKICLRAMEKSDADFFYETLQDMDIQKNESDIRVPMSHKACADFAMEQASKGNVFTDGKFYDEILYGLTKDEFSELVK